MKGVGVNTQLHIFLTLELDGGDRLASRADRFTLSTIGRAWRPSGGCGRE